MNSKLSEDTPSSSREDNNANLQNEINHSKGAIPKTKAYLKNSQISKNIKVNNNVENIPSLNIENSASDDLTLNGFSKPLTNHFVNNTITAGKSIEHFDRKNLDINSAGSLQDINLDDGSESTSSEENELSVSDDGCIYTYKGDGVADLPSSFYNIELPVFDNIEVRNEQREGNSSPEMDFLEMDFDPGPSGDADSESSSSQIDQTCELPSDNEEQKRNLEPCCSNNLEAIKSFEPIKESSQIDLTVNLTKNEETESNSKPCLKTVQKEIRMPWSCSISQRTRASKQLRIIKKHMNSFGELSSPKETITPTAEYLCSICAEEGDEQKFMIWSDQEASLKQITQIGPSSCGATAVLNVLTALRLPIPTLDVIHEAVQTRHRANFSPLPEYLKSRSRAGCSHKEIINGLTEISNGKVYARFFSMYPERRVNMYKWLGFWIQHGAVPVATLNLQKCEGPIPDSWHHQMVYGVDPENMYLTNPLECVNSNALWHQLVSESVLLIRREDILSRWNSKSDIIELGRISDTRWKDLNVLGQVAKIVREQPRESRENSTVTPHIKIPADYKSGVTIAIDKNSAAYSLLRECPELPLLNQNNAAVIS